MIFGLLCHVFSINKCLSETGFRQAWMYMANKLNLCAVIAALYQKEVYLL
ncbi:hypothetical protein HMPREF9370_0298 [Neisseria wadsworthii 9715]|uniref:Uncharacterized protein n=1 Tax=Neisseria wadsworthii 9715 TaxID=1030841 RepID=G4CMI9_9NEIS|nr:hypothetical protein HMPREF9370_0298 [Neisseria wadsworthii 9715]